MREEEMQTQKEREEQRRQRDRHIETSIPWNREKKPSLRPGPEAVMDDIGERPRQGESRAWKGPQPDSKKPNEEGDGLKW